MLSRAGAPRRFTTENGTVLIRKRMQVGCGMCHDNPLMSGMQEITKASEGTALSECSAPR